MNWILEYYQQIRCGAVTVGRWVREWYARVVKGLDEGDFDFDGRKANRAIKFVENFCRHHEGKLGGQLIRLEVWQKALLSVLFGIMDKEGHRQFREAFIIVGRKNGKTLLAAAVAAYMTFLDGEYGARIYFTAPKLQQSTLCFDAFFQMIQKEPELSQLATKRRTDIYIKTTNTSAMPLAFSAKKSDGLNPSLCICDEIASWSGDAGLKNYEVLKSALGARTQPLILSISTAGYQSESIYDELFKRATGVISGTSPEKRLAPFLYMIDDPERWNDINELKKSNPNMGVSVTHDYLIDEAAVAEGSLSKRAEFLTKYANVKQNASTAWLTSKDVKLCFPGNRFTFEDFRGCYAMGGIDLSQTTDLTACVLLVERGGVLYFFTQFFLPAAKIDEAIARDNVPYRQYIERGLLKVSGENFVDYHDCYAWFTRLIEQYEIYPLMIGYDKYSAQYLVQDLESYGFKTEPVWQGFNLSPVYNEMEGLIRDGRLQCADDNDLMKIHLLDSALKMETESNRRRLIKMRKNAHIDGVAALSDAMLSRHLHYEEMPQLKNE